jgi:uncharacterized protein YndB with AHSA1/START domain
LVAIREAYNVAARRAEVRDDGAVADPIARAEIALAAAPARVWNALQPEQLTGWLCEQATGELAVGGRLALGWPSLGLDTELVPLVVEPPARLVLGGAGLSAAERLELRLTATAGGGTRLVLSHAGFGAGERGHDRADGSAAGWQVALRLLDLYLGGREGQPLRSVAAIGTASRPLTRLWPALGDHGELAGWLGPIDGDLGDEGDPLVLTLAGRRRPAIVLARVPPYELAFSLPALGAVLRLRLVSLDGHATLVCVQLLGWSPGADAALATMADPLAAALDRLLARHAATADA